MTPDEARLSYRRAAVQDASPAGLMIILSDLFVGDLRSAIAAIQECRIDDRCERLKHALLVLQAMEDSVDMRGGGETAVNLARFYAFVRKQVLDAQFQCDPHILEKVIVFVLDLREAWRVTDRGSHPERDAIMTAQPSSVTVSPMESVGWSA